MTENVFVYGTLKQGYGNYPVMERAEGQLISKAHTDGKKYDLYDLGPYPAVVKGKFSIIGELYVVEDLKPLDRLEGYPRFYNREKTKVWGLGEHIYDSWYAWIYFIEDAETLYQYQQSKVKTAGYTKEWI